EVDRIRRGSAGQALVRNRQHGKRRLSEPGFTGREERTMSPSVEPATLTRASFEELVREMIVRIGEDPQREGLVGTPDRVLRSWAFLTRGYKEDPDAMLRKALFTVTY